MWHLTQKALTKDGLGDKSEKCWEGIVSPPTHECQICKLEKERDDARRLICQMQSVSPAMSDYLHHAKPPEAVAKEKGWEYLYD